MKIYDVKQAVMAQSKLCQNMMAWDFSGDCTHGTGVCPFCHRNIYEEGGYDLIYAGNRLITGCPFCHRSYVE